MTQGGSAPPISNALSELRDRAYLLSLGNVYLCEDVFLRKIGNEIEALLDRFGEEILSIKRRFPGQLAGDSGTGPDAEELRSIAQDLKDPHPGLAGKCAAGELGRDLEKSVKALDSAVEALIAKVEGELPEYSKKDAVLDALSVAKTPARVVSSTMALILKGVILVLLLALGPLAYLVLTMDTEAKLRRDISRSEARISWAKERMASLAKERAELVLKIESLRAENPPREDKITTMELNIQVHSLDDKSAQAEVEISNQEEMIKANLARIEEIRDKPFVDRLLDR